MGRLTAMSVVYMPGNPYLSKESFRECTRKVLENLRTILHEVKKIDTYLAIPEYFLHLWHQALPFLAVLELSQQVRKLRVFTHPVLAKY